MVAATAIRRPIIDEPMPVHVRDAADAVMLGINRTQPPAVVKMHDAIDARIKDANRLGGDLGIQHLALFAARIQRNRDTLASYAAGEPFVDLPAHLVGFNVFHFDAAEERIDRAVRVLSGEVA